MNCLFVLSLFKDAFTAQITQAKRNCSVMNWRGLGRKLSWGNIGTTETFVTKHDDEYVGTASDPVEILNGDFTNRKHGPSCRSPILYTEDYLSN